MSEQPPNQPPNQPPGYGYPNANPYPGPGGPNPYAGGQSGPYQQPPYQGGHQQPGYPAGAVQPGSYTGDPNAPYGYDPFGRPYSDKSKIVAGLLQVLIPLGIGRFYINDTKTGVWQLVVRLLTCGVGALWPFIDGIVILAGNPRDSLGRPMKTS